MSTEGVYLNKRRSNTTNPQFNITLNGEKIKAFPQRSGTGQGTFTLIMFIQHNFGYPSHGNQRRK